MARKLQNVSDGNPYDMGEIQVKKKLKQHKEYTTYFAENKQLKRSVILKSLEGHRAQRYLSDNKKLDTFHEDIRRTGRMNHPNVATMFDIGEHEGVIYFAREYIEGVPISEVDYRKPAWEYDLADHLVKITRALIYVHGQANAHLNLKPSNIWITDSRNLKLTDFYLQAFSEDSPRHDSWRYKAPELLTHDKGDARSDIYSLGLIFYELLACQHPYEKAKILNAKQVGKKKIIPLMPEKNECNAGWNAVIMKCLAHKDSRRYQDSSQLMADARQLQGHLLPSE